MWQLDHNDGWVLKNWCLWIVVLEKTLESPLDFKEIKPVNPKGNQPWIFIGTTDAEAETAILWPSHEKSWLIGKDPDARKDWEQKTIEDEMVRWHHRLNGREFEQTRGNSEGQGSLLGYNPWSHRVRHDSVTEEQHHPKPNGLNDHHWFIAHESCQGGKKKSFLYLLALITWVCKLNWQKT